MTLAEIIQQQRQRRLQAVEARNSDLAVIYTVSNLIDPRVYPKLESTINQFYGQIIDEADRVIRLLEET